MININVSPKEYKEIVLVLCKEKPSFFYSRRGSLYSRKKNIKNGKVFIIDHLIEMICKLKKSAMPFLKKTRVDITFYNC